MSSGTLSEKKSTARPILSIAMNHTDRRKPAILIDPVNFYQTYGNILHRQSHQNTNPLVNPPINLGQNLQTNQPILDGLMSKFNTNNLFSEIPPNTSPAQGLSSTAPMKQPPTSLQPSVYNGSLLSSLQQHTAIAQPRDDFLFVLFYFL